MFQVNRFILTAVQGLDGNRGIFLITISRIFMLPDRKQSDEHSIFCEIPTDTCHVSLLDQHISW